MHEYLEHTLSLNLIDCLMAIDIITKYDFCSLQVPEHFLPVVTVALREFFNSVQAGKDSESSWKKQIYKIIQRYDEPVPEYFKTPEFLKQLE